MRQEIRVKVCSDHFPLILNTNPIAKGQIRFENMWLGHPNFKKECVEWWWSLNHRGWEGFKIMEKLKV